MCADQEVVLVGGGNSAGQAVVYLAEHVAKVWMVVRRDDLAATMSRYLVDRISGLCQCRGCSPRPEICELKGAEGILSAVHCRHTLTGGRKIRRPARHLFLFIGADPNTGWLEGSGVALDPKGFVLTGADAGTDTGGNRRRSLETSRRGIYAIGDIRAGSIKRVAAAVGEGARSSRPCTLISPRRRLRPQQRPRKQPRRGVRNRDGQSSAAGLCKAALSQRDTVLGRDAPYNGIKAFCSVRAVPLALDLFASSSGDCL